MRNPKIKLVGEDTRPSKVVVAVLIPTRGSNCSEFTFDLAHLMAYCCMGMISAGVADVRLFRQSGTYIDVNRCDLVKAALEDPEVTHVFWLDDDMHFPPDALLQLLNRNTAIVGANYSRRRYPLEPVAIKSVGGVGTAGMKVDTKEDSTGLEEADAIGLGCALVRRDVFEAMEYPWFDTYYDRTLHKWVGEDVFFCRSALAAGFKTYVDHDLSHLVEHMGQQGFTLAHARAYMKGREQLMTQQQLADGE